MTTFWRPVRLSRSHTAIPVYQKRLGHGYYELWFRCDLCFRSDVMSAAYTWRSGTDDSQLCAACDLVAQNEGDLSRDGWVRVP